MLFLDIEDSVIQLFSSVGCAVVGGAVLISLTATSLALHAATLPGAATPGGVQKTLQRPNEYPVSDLPTIQVPKVVDRPLDTNSGPKIEVKQFVVEGVEDVVHKNISNAVVNDLVEAERLKREGQFTFGQLQLVADQITGLYRQSGLILAQAFVPEQDVVEGLVVLRVMPGNLGAVLVEDNKRYSSARLTGPFKELIGGAVDATAVETALLRVADMPGMSAFGVFQPGSELGEADLALKVTEKLIDANVSFNNYGTELTGQYQSLLDVMVNNPLGIGDRLQVGFQQSYRPKLAEFGYLTYQAPVFSGWVQGLTAGGGFSRNEFEVGGELKDVGIEGVTEVANLFLEKSWIRTRNANLLTRFDFSRKQSKVFVSGNDFSQDVLSVASLETRFDRIDTILGGGINQGLVNLSHGFGNVLASTQADDLPGSGRRNLAGESLGSGFNKVAFDYSRLQNLVPGHSLIMRIAGQFSDDLLPSLEQMSIGGPFSVRAYPQSEFLVDKGVFASLEWVLNAPGFANAIAFENRTWGEVLQVSLFVDHGTGWIDESVIEDQVELSGAGMGLQMYVPASLVSGGVNYLGSLFNQEWAFYLPGEFSFRLDVATPLGSRDASNREEPQVYVNTTYSY